MLPQARVQDVLALMPLIAHTVEPEQRLRVVSSDSADNRVLQCALAGEASHIVSGDGDLLALETFRGIAIVPPAEFLKLLKKNR